jgi:hypothetical protein
VGAGHVRVVAIRPLAELELEHLACGVQSVERLVDSGPAHRRARVRYPMEELLSAGMLATLHQCAHDSVALPRQSMSALAQPAHDFIHAASHDAALWRMSRYKY